MFMRYVFGAIGIVVLIILIIILLMGGDRNSSGRKTESIVLTNYINSGSEVILTTYGPVVGNESRQSVSLTVTPQNRFFALLQTYELTPVETQTFDNNLTAYSYFMHSLSGLGFSNQRTVKNQDQMGACPFGHVTVYQLINQGKEVLNTWSTNCSAKDGTFAGNAASVARLFQAQYPNYSDLTQSTSF